MITSKDRSGWFGASDTWAVMGNWETDTFARLWLEKLGVVRNTFTSPALQAGTLYEHRVLDALGVPIRDRQIRIRRLRLRVNLDGEDLEEIIGKLRREIPDIAIRTTLITGFPGETKEQHEELMDFVDQMEFDRLGVFTYSPEEGTPAAQMEDQIPEEVKEDRQAELMELQQEIAFDLAEDMIGREVLVMIEGKVADENAYVGRTYKDAPNVDGLIFVNTDEELMSGDFARVKVTGAAEYDLIGELM